MTLIRRVREADAHLEEAVRTGAEQVERVSVGRSLKDVSLKENGKMRQ